jgi:hypothetical protein
MLPFDRFAFVMNLDPTGRVHHGLELVAKYRLAVERQNRLVFDAWTQKDFPRALVELHYFLVAVDRVNDGLKLIADTLEGDVADFIRSKDFGDYRDARNHFEHLDDRPFGTKKNAPQPITENGTTRNIHYGLQAAAKRFNWGAKSIDISKEFVCDFLSYVAKAERMIVP